MKNKSLFLTNILLSLIMSTQLMAQSPEQKSLRDYLNGGSAHNSVVFFQGEDYGLQLRDNEYQGMSDTDALFHFKR
jgi:hypothetical protein